MARAERSWQPITRPGDTPAPAGAYSPGVRAGDFLFVSGQVPRDPRTGQVVGHDTPSQARQVMKNLREVLEGGGASLADVVSVTVYLANVEDWGVFNDFYREAFEAPYPTRTVVGANLRGVLVEVSAIAFVGSE